MLPLRSLLGVDLTVDHVVSLHIGEADPGSGAAGGPGLGDDAELGLGGVAGAWGAAPIHPRLHHGQAGVGVKGLGAPGEHVVVLQVGVQVVPPVIGFWRLQRVLATQQSVALTFDQPGARGGVHSGKHQWGAH